VIGPWALAPRGPAQTQQIRLLKEQVTELKRVGCPPPQPLLRVRVLSSRRPPLQESAAAAEQAEALRKTSAQIEAKGAAGERAARDAPPGRTAWG
jgi:hypothetical protein